MNYTINTFDWEYYIGQYIDLRNAGILTQKKAWKHWRLYGHKENRTHRKKEKKKFKPTSINNNLVSQFIEIEDCIKNNNYRLSEDIINKMTNFNFPIKKNWLMNVSNVFYLIVSINGGFGNFYVIKRNTNIKIMRNLGINVEEINLGEHSHNVKEPKFNLVAYKNKTYIFDELAYNHMIWRYNFNDYERETILNFCKNANYIIITSELFKDDRLQTIGMDACNIEFSECFFKNAKKIIICNTKNIYYLVKHGIKYDQIYYFPPYSYSKILNNKPLIKNENQDIDILFYGNVVHTGTKKEHWLKYGYHTILSNLENWNKYKFVIKAPHTDYGGIFDTDKDEMLKRTKIIIHPPSFENLHTFPWAKVTELMYKKNFFIIEENEEMYFRNYNKFIVSYKRNDITDLKNKIEYYLKHENKRKEIINKCYNFIITEFNIDNLFRRFKI